MRIEDGDLVSSIPGAFGRYRGFQIFSRYYGNVSQLTLKEVYHNYIVKLYAKK